MASQRITIVKLGGVSAEIALQRLAMWSAARQMGNPNLWSPDQWPAELRKEADEFAERLRAHALALPIIHFIEWADKWSMGDMLSRWLSAPEGTKPFGVHANRFEILAYPLPDGGRLAEYLAAAGPQQWAETEWYIGRLREAIVAWEEIVENAALVVLRYVVDGSALDEEVTASLKSCPEWLL